MEKPLLTFLGMLIFFNMCVAQNDTIYIMKNGVVVEKYNVNNQIDSIVFHQSQVTPGETFIDPRDSTVYPFVKIGNQIWMAENLKYLPQVVGKAKGSSTIPYNYVYDYEGTNVAEAKATANYNAYGVLYNWAAAIKVCPVGWHLPSKDEWIELFDYLGGSTEAGGKLKETGFTHWNDPNNGATNETGFTARPGGLRYYYEGAFSGIRWTGNWWTVSEQGTNYAWGIHMYNNSGGVDKSRSTHKEFGYSVRCLKD